MVTNSDTVLAFGFDRNFLSGIDKNAHCDIIDKIIKEVYYLCRKKREL